MKLGEQLTLKVIDDIMVDLFFSMKVPYPLKQKIYKLEREVAQSLVRLESNVIVKNSLYENR